MIVGSEEVRDQAMSMQGAVVLITGATAGIGFHTAKGLAALGAQVVVTGRSEARGRAAVQQLRQRAGHDQVRFLATDHSTVAGNLALAKRLSGELGRLDVLVNNVGGTPSSQRHQTQDGYEATLATHFVGPAALTVSLLPLLRSGAPSRVVTVVSSAHAMWKRDPFQDLQSEQRFVGIEAYAHAKLMSLLWTFALARRLEGSGVVVNATNPGMAWTPGTQAMTREAVPAWRWVWPVVRWFQRRASAEAASRSSVFLASSEEAAAVTGRYFESKTQPERPSALALDVGNQERAWALAAELVAHARTCQERS